MINRTKYKLISEKAFKNLGSGTEKTRSWCYKMNVHVLDGLYIFCLCVYKIPDGFSSMFEYVAMFL